MNWYLFILEELDGASRGNDASKVFALTSGIGPHEYQNANAKIIPELDDMQQQILDMTLQLAPDQELMSEFRRKLCDQIMQSFQFGKYSQVDGRTQDLLKRLQEVLLSDQGVMPALSPNIPVPASAPMRHIHFRKKNIEAALGLLSNLREITGDSDDSIILKALNGAE